MEMSDLIPDHGLESLGLLHLQNVYWNRSTPSLYENAVRRFEGRISHMGPLVISMGQHTGRAARDRYVVKEEQAMRDVWWGKINVPFAEEHFDELLRRMRAHLRAKNVYVQDCWACADARYRTRVRVITEYAWQSLFARNMFIRPPRDPLVHKNFRPDLTVLCLPDFHADPDLDGTRSGTFVALHLSRRLVLIGGTAYAGEIKKSVFSTLNFFLPPLSVLPMHCAASVSRSDPSNVAIFLGLSGTGKTTLSADPDRLLVGDDEHGWSDEGVFNFEGGCYAKVIRLSKEAEPDVHACTERFGTILENVGIDPALRHIDLNDASITENTRASYAITAISNHVESGVVGHPSHVIMLTADAFGVLPPVAKLTPEQAMYHFLSGYTAKLGGTEMGIDEPSATFSPCFGAPFITRNPMIYARMLAQKLREHHATCWLVNTGWTGGPYGTGHRVPIQDTRAMLRAILG
ncbi:MAG TPA: phosphoenolpyruvate carboxykinase (ATP), partial [Myxococcota bacterium]|nr:phosphoenolpyruvate carboxykinase (ATP) [Myxococcota bacterium]